MHAAIAVPGNSRTILTHVFGCGLEDDRYVVERFQAMANGDIRRSSGDEGPAQGAAHDRVAEGGPGAAARAHRDHRLHRPAHPGRRAVLGRDRDRTFLRPQTEALGGVLT